MMTRRQAIEKLHQLGACEEACEWFENSGLDPEEAWNQCNEPDWLAWLAYSLNIDLETIVRAVYESAKVVSHLIPDEEKYSRQALELVERWLAGEEVSANELKVAAASSTGAASFISVASTGAVVYAARAASSVHAFFGYASAALTYATMADSSIDIAGIVRKHIPWSMIEEKLNV